MKNIKGLSYNTYYGLRLLNICSAALITSSFLLLSIFYCFVIKGMGNSIEHSSLTYSASKSVLMHSPIISFAGVYLAVIAKRVICEYIGENFVFSKVSRTNLILLVLLTGLVVLATYNVYPYMSKLEHHFYDAYTILMGLVFFGAAYGVRINSTDKYKLLDVKTRVSTFKIHRKHVFIKRKYYNCLINIISSVFLIIVFGIISLHLAYRGIIF